ncbi:Rieske 2Fe-2S domain-containing protein [Propionibacteriaceae bacterium Y1685]|uniref:cytochrome bc1 complex Rieske iron-sulfur subunit n=1 Tax=Microlunatus sp. Y1700 TaxID=3418487 RepID=UPI003B7ACFFE
MSNDIDHEGPSRNVVDERHPVADPGLEEHLPRPTDVDEKAARRAELQVTGLFAVVPLLAIAFVVIYFAVPREMYVEFGALHANAQHVGLGVTLGLAILAIGIGAVHWARQLMSDHEIVEERHPATSSEEDRKATLAEFDKGVEDSAITRRKLVGRSLLGALGIVAIPAVVTLADLGEWPTPTRIGETLEKTIWGDKRNPEDPGVYIVNDVTYKRIKAADLRIGQLVNAEPENLQDYHGHHLQTEKSKAALVIVRMEPSRIKVPESRRDWQVGGILAYSKICTHVGCPISLWEQQTHHLLCPCHQSTFDLGDSGVVVFGPAARALPQLPIAVDDEGYLYATSDFTVPVGPSYFERDSTKDFKKGDN